MRIKPLKGAEGHPRGANEKWHTGNVSGMSSRGYNALERVGVTNELKHKLSDALELVREKHSKKFLKYYRKLVSAYKTHNHEIVLSCGMGSSTIKINNKLLQDYPSRGIFALLFEIEQTMNWDWSAYLDGEKLN